MNISGGNYFGVLVFLAVIISIINCHPLSDIYAMCERYTQCRTIATLDERLCLGNTRAMPFWLEPRDLTDEMAQHCHKILKPYYKQLERLEREQTQQLFACLMEHAIPMNSGQRSQCHQNLLRSAKFNFEENLMDRIPTNCFQGIDRRMEKQCGILKSCCNSVENCANFENFEISTKIRNLKESIKVYGKQCQLGLAIEDLLLNEDAKDAKLPHGNITVTFNSNESAEQLNQKVETAHKVDDEQRLLVRVTTAEEELQRLRESGDEIEANKLQKALDEIEGKAKDQNGGITEIDGDVPTTESSTLPSTTSTTLPSTTTTTLPSTTTTLSVIDGGDDDDMWSTKVAKILAGLEIATEPSSTSTSTTPPSTTSPTTTTTPKSTTTTPVRLITDTPQPEPSQEDSEEALLPNQPSPSSPHPRIFNDAPKSLSTNQPFPVEDILRKYSHVKTLNKLVEHFNDQNSESLTKNENSKTPTFIDSKKLHEFYDRWENSIREKLATGPNDSENPDSAQEYARLLKTLNTLRNVIYNN